MRLPSKIVWSDGMYLSSHHFQAQNRYFENSAHFVTTSLWRNAWGFADYQLSDDALRDGHVMLEHAQGMFEDGLAFDIPESDARPDLLDVASAFTPTSDHVVVSLAVPSWQLDGQNCSFAESPVAGTRYTVETRMLNDDTTGRDERPVRLAKKNIQLTASQEPSDSLLTLPVARVKRDGTGHFVFDPTFVPPCVRLGASKYLMGMLMRLVGKIEDKASILTGDRDAFMGAFKSGLSGGQVSQFWLLHAMNSGLSPLRHLLYSKHGHPEQLFREMLRLAGALCTFGLDSHPDSLPAFDHRNPGACFAALDQHIRQHLDLAAPPEALKIPLHSLNQYFYAGKVDDQRCFARSRWILGIHSPIGEADLIAKVPKLVKICSSKFVTELVKRAVPGLTLSHLPVPPPDISARVDFQYFAISRSGPCWEHITKMATVGVYVPGEMPNPELTLMVLLEK